MPTVATSPIAPLPQLRSVSCAVQQLALCSGDLALGGVMTVEWLRRWRPAEWCSRSQQRNPQVGGGGSAGAGWSTRLSRAPRGLPRLRRSSAASYRNPQRLIAYTTTRDTTAATAGRGRRLEGAGLVWVAAAPDLQACHYSPGKQNILRHAFDKHQPYLPGCGSSYVLGLRVTAQRLERPEPRL